MQRDFLEPGGFGAVLGNDVSLLRAAIAPTRRVLRACRAAGHAWSCTRAKATGPTCRTCAPAKRARGNFATGIGDPGPMGRILVRGEPGHDIIPRTRPGAGRAGGGQARQRRVLRHRPGAMLRGRGITQLLVCGVTTEVCVNTTVREANDRGFDCLVLEDCTGSYFPEFQAGRDRDDQGAGRHLRLGRRRSTRCSARRDSQMNRRTR